MRSVIILSALVSGIVISLVGCGGGGGGSSVATSSSSSSSQISSAGNSSSLAPLLHSTLLKTGQSISNVNFDDGYYENGVNRSFSKTDNIVTDNARQLQWQDDAAAKTTTKRWIVGTDQSDTSGDTAATYCSNLSLGGYSDWRLPTAEEFSGILNYGRYNSALDTAFQNTASNGYWSSTTNVSDDKKALVVYLNSGNLGDGLKDYKTHVRCVRVQSVEANATFIRDSRGVVIDSATKLQWQDDLDAKTNVKSWSDAIRYCEELSLGGVSDWKLPNINELKSLLDYDRYDPALDAIFQNFESNIYLSSTTNASDNNSAWIVDFEDGSQHVMNKSSRSYIRCVRAK